MDAGVVNITSPVSGCALPAADTVIIEIFNYEDSINVPPDAYSVTYVITGPIPATVTEIVSSPANTDTILPNSTYTYSFATLADFSVAGTYTIDAYITLPGDVNNANDTLTGYQVISDALSVGGTVSSDATVCSGSNGPTTLTLAGETGSVVRWEYSTDGGLTWINIVNTTNTQDYLNLTITTMYRAVVQSGACPSANATAATITIDPVSVGGTISANATVCSGSNTDTLTLNGYNGSILNWALSTDGGGSWTPVANTSDTLSYTNLTITTWYIAEVQSGSVCAIDTSSIAVISVDPISVGGTVAGSSTVCEGANSGTVILSGQTGNISGWEYSIDGGGTWLNIANTTSTQSYLNLTTTTMYRALVQSGVCPSANSTAATITVDPLSVGGTIGANATVCSGSNGDTLTLSGYSGSILNWAFSTDGGGSWTPIANTTDTLSYTNLTTTTWYIAEVRSGVVCAIDTSSIAVISVDPISVGGTVAGSDTVCSGSNYDTLILSGHTDSVLNWEYSTDGGITWINISNTDTMQIYSNLTATKMYRAVVQSGGCQPANSTAATITVDPVSASGTISADAMVCGGSNGDTLTLSVYTGSVLNWEFSTDTGLTWTTVINSTDTLSYSNLTTPTWYRAIAQSGVCPNDTSSVAIISVDSATIGGTISGDTTVCSSPNGDTLTLSGHTGIVLRWEYSTDNGGTWINVTNTSTTQTYSNITITTIYRALVQNGVCLPAYSSSVAVTVDVSVGGTVGNDAIVCSGSNIDTLTLSGHSGNVLNWEFSVDGGITWASIADTNTTLVYSNLITPTMYRAVVQNGVCAIAYASPATIAIAQSVAGVVGNDADVCSGSNGNTLTLSSYTGTILNWVSSTDTGQTWVIEPDTIDTLDYTLNYTNLTVTTWYAAIVQFGVCVPDTSLIAVITVYPTPVVVFSALPVCIGDTTQFINSSSTGSGYINLWDFADNSGSSTLLNPTYLYNDPGIYNVSLNVISNIGCVGSTSVNVTVNSLPVADITPNGPTEFCLGNNVVLSGDSVLIYIHSWNTGDSTPGITVASSGTYIDTVTDLITGCVNMDSVTITVYPLPIANAGNDTSVSLGYSVYLNGQGGVNYAWSPTTYLDFPSIANPLSTPSLTTTYILTVTDENLCVNTDTVTISVIVDYNFIISNILTPNGDGDNDTWNIDFIEEYPECEVAIYNRFGQEILPPKSSYMNDWDGTYNGSKLPDGTYYYILQCPGKVFSGGVTILRGN